MEFEFVRKKAENFGSLNDGDVFIYEDDIYMKMEEVYGCDKCCSRSDHIVANAFCLGNGHWYIIEDSEVIKKVDAKLIVAE